MLYSMTGFAQAEGQYKDRRIHVELRTVNHKGLDLRIALPERYREQEMNLRRRLQNELLRGKADLRVELEATGVATTDIINHEVAMAFYKSLHNLAGKLGAETSNLLPAVLHLPHVVREDAYEATEPEWKAIDKMVKQAVAQLQQFRKQEGKGIEKALKGHVKRINELLKAVEAEDPARRRQLRQDLQKQVRQWVAAENLDQSRMEQELVYYLDKMDLTEEKNRLQSHCDYFMQTLKAEPGQGKKLNFIAQEMGREVNTLGAKANDAAIQHKTVEMKDELGKIREQVMNVV